MSVSKKDIDFAFDKPDFKDWNGENPILDFVEGVFTGHNWNDGRLNVLRRIIYDLLPEYNDDTIVEDDRGEFKLFRTFIEDQNYVFIVYENYFEKDDDDSIWHIEWYKSRGKTEKVNLNGEPINLGQLQKLLYRLNEIR